MAASDDAGSCTRGRSKKKTTLTTEPAVCDEPEDESENESKLDSDASDGSLMADAVAELSARAQRDAYEQQLRN